MTPAIVVARQVVREAARRRLLLALILLTIVVIALTVWGVSRIDDLRNAGQPLPDPQKKTIVSQLLILVMFMFSWVLSLAAAFIAAPAISGELESGIALALLARPMSRAEYVAGKWLGLVALATRLLVPPAGRWRGAVWSLEPSLVIAAQWGLGPGVAANPFFAAEPPPAAYVAWAVMWIVAMLALAVWSFRSREV